ncbi:SOH1-domain-containing protein [Linnemannia elongata AG-77]|uniref:Mediator of RNA polymerase II transcription subunit 31 n=1 Tax=Linnemannia elongata AG-77 TaxID=1314771 RepID=A0A197JP09_9FUNG|nr:SOH1-domain-containing protein [Linnemannia elongata AG-77]
MVTDSPIQTEDEYEQLKRFQVELEFVQCLSNPWYLHHLAQQQYFNQDAFVRYLDYLQYFRKPEYAKFIIYPHCLHFLTLLQHKSFRDQLAKQDTASFVHERQYYHWQFLRNQDKVVRMEIMPDGTMAEIKTEPRLPLTDEGSDAAAVVAAADGAAGAGTGVVAGEVGSGAGNTPLPMDADVPGVATAGAPVSGQLGASPFAGLGVGIINGPNGSHFPRP